MFIKKLKINIILISLLERVWLKLANRYALNLFLTPPKAKTYKGLYKTECSYDMTHVGSNKWVNTYIWGKGEKTILLCHAWGLNGSYMSKFVSLFLEKNYRIIAFDALGHGLSSNRYCDMFEYSDSIFALYNKYNVNYIIGHSLGAACTFLALNRYPIHINKFVSISCFSDSNQVLEKFQQYYNLSDSIVNSIKNNIEDKYNIKWDSLSPKNLINHINIPITIVHDSNDTEINFSNALELNKKDSTLLITTKNLGHNNIIFSQKTIKKIIDEINM